MSCGGRLSPAFLGHPDATVVAEGLRHEGQLTLVVAGNRDAGRVDLRVAGIGEGCAALVKARQVAVTLEPRALVERYSASP